ncbi:unnamed protein product, partial [Ectocarpus sp. 8 AP-2014]
GPLALDSGTAVVYIAVFSSPPFYSGRAVVYRKRESSKERDGLRGGGNAGEQSHRRMAQQSSETSTRRAGMNLLEWLSWNLGLFWNQTTRKTPRIAGTFVDTAVVASRDFKGSRNYRDRETASKILWPSSVRTRAVRSR